MAEHLAHNYGSQAHELAKMVQLTGKRWPLVGKRLVSDMPFIESEVRSKVKRAGKVHGSFHVSTNVTMVTMVT